MLKAIKRLLKDEEGQGMVEYALVIGVIVVLLFVAIKATNVDDWIKDVIAKLTANS